MGRSFWRLEFGRRSFGGRGVGFLAAFEGVGEVRVCGLEGRMRSVEGGRRGGSGICGFRGAVGWESGRKGSEGGVEMVGLDFGLWEVWEGRWVEVCAGEFWEINEL